MVLCDETQISDTKQQTLDLSNTFITKSIGITNVYIFI